MSGAAEPPDFPDGQRDAEARYRSVVQSALDAIIAIDVDNRITEFNPAAEAIFRHRRQDVLGRDLAELIIPEEMRMAHRQGLQRHRDSATAPRLGRRIEVEALRADGSRFPVELTVTREGGSGTSQFTAFIRDLSQQRLAEARAAQLAENLSASERLLGGVLSNLPGMAFQCALEDDAPFSFVSDGSVELCGYGGSDFVLKPIHWIDLVHEADRPILLKARRRATAGDRRYECTYRIRIRTGAERWVMERGVVTVDPAQGGRIDGLVVDVTAVNLARQQVELLNAELESRVVRRTSELELANAELETFSYSIAHDLRAPLTSIAGFTRVIEERVGAQGELTHYFDRVRSGIRHMGDLIDAMLLLARVKGSMPKKESVDLAQQAREIIDRLNINEPGRTLRLDIPQTARVSGDALLLRQVMENLIGNAWKFSRNAPVTHIRLTCAATPQGEWTVSI